MIYLADLLKVIDGDQVIWIKRGDKTIFDGLCEEYRDQVKREKVEAVWYSKLFNHLMIDIF